MFASVLLSAFWERPESIGGWVGLAMAGGGLLIMLYTLVRRLRRVFRPRSGR